MPRLNDVLGELPSGTVLPVSDDFVGMYLRKQYINSDKEERRRREMRKRLDFYKDRPQKHLENLVTNLFNHRDVIADVKRYIPYCKFQNVVRRVSDELSTVYQDAATRKVGRDSNKQYQLLLELVQIDAVMRRANKYVNFLNEVLLWYTVREDTPKLKVLTPDEFFAVAHPTDSTRLIAVIFPITREGFPTNTLDPAWEVWTEHETFQLNGAKHIMRETREEHDLGMIPGVLVHREMPDTTLLDWHTGDDLIAAHEAVALLNILMLREQKAGTKVAFLAGDIGNTATGQAFDRETPIHLQEGIAPGTLDLGANPQAYIDAARSVIKQVAANYGIPESVFDLSYQATSGFEIELKRVGLREKRRQQVMTPWRPAERRLAEVMSRVNEQHLPEFSFNTSKWAINFGDIDTPQDPAQRLIHWKQKREMGLMTTVDMILELNPEFSEDDALKKLEENLATETLRVAAMQNMARMNAGMNANPETPLPEENGEEGLEASGQRGRQGTPNRSPSLEVVQ